MRLSTQEVQAIINAFASFAKDDASELFLYGSRTDPQKRGGDIDLLWIVSTEKLSLVAALKYQIISAIHAALGERKIDLTITDRVGSQSNPFIQLILPTAISLKKWP